MPQKAISGPATRRARPFIESIDNSNALPGCPHADITDYYSELWRALEARAKLHLQSIAVCRFPWPADGLDAVLRLQGVRRRVGNGQSEAAVADGWEECDSNIMTVR